MFRELAPSFVKTKSRFSTLSRSAAIFPNRWRRVRRERRLNGVLSTGRPFQAAVSFAIADKWRPNPEITGNAYATETQLWTFLFATSRFGLFQKWTGAAA